MPHVGNVGEGKVENELLDDMDFERYDKVKCSKIEQMLPKLMKMVEGEMRRNDRLLFRKMRDNC